MTPRPAARHHLSLIARIVLLGAIGASSVIAVSAAAQVASTTQGDAGREMARISNGMSNQWNADMMHDGLRADVFAALLAGTDTKAQDELEVRAVDQRSTAILDSFDQAGALAPPALRRTYDEVRPRLAAYAQGAASIAHLAARDPAAARAKLADFLALFGELEGKLGAIDDEMLAAVNAAQVHGESAGADGKRLILIVSLLALAASIVAAATVLRAVRTPLSRVLSGLQRVAGRDLTVQVEVTRDDELGQMATALNHAVSQIRSTIAAAAHGTATLTAASTELLTVSGELTGAADDTAARVRTAAGHAADVDGSVAAMTSATDELSASIREIAGQAATAAAIASEAARDAADTREAMAALNSASQEIGDIVHTITTIAGQTNLLALNATIEAARAGEAGKGFAVVATEVKDLAQETARATDNITAKISAIQGLTEGTGLLIERINDVIARIDDNQSMIAAAVEEQSATTARMSSNVSEVSAATGQITTTINDVTGSTETASAVAIQSRQNAEHLSVVATQISDLIHQFTYQD